MVIHSIYEPIPVGEIPDARERKRLAELEREIDQIREEFSNFCGNGAESQLASTLWRARKEQERMEEYHRIQQWVQQTQRQRENNEILMLQMWRHDE
eukprot:1891324-Rhodomonas_salina.1